VPTTGATIEHTAAGRAITDTALEVLAVGNVIEQARAITKTMSEQIGFISVDQWDEQSFAVPIEQFDYASLDKPEDYIREAIAEGRDVMPIIQGLAALTVERRQVEAIAKVMGLIRGAQKPKQRVEEIEFACGLSIADGVTLISLAKKYGVSKQAIQRNVDVICDALQIRKTRTMRGTEAREKMSKTNFRNKKP
jgi:hypothetical protein